MATQSNYELDQESKQQLIEAVDRLGFNRVLIQLETYADERFNKSGMPSAMDYYANIADGLKATRKGST